MLKLVKGLNKLLSATMLENYCIQQNLDSQHGYFEVIYGPQKICVDIDFPYQSDTLEWFENVVLQCKHITSLSNKPDSITNAVNDEFMSKYKVIAAKLV